MHPIIQIPLRATVAERLALLDDRLGTERVDELLDRLLRDSLPPAPSERPAESSS